MQVDDRQMPEMPFVAPVDVHRALLMLVEDFGALDWNLHRQDTADDSRLRALVEINQQQQMVRAAMVLEWLRHRLPRFDEQLRKYLFASEDLHWRADQTPAATDIADFDHMVR